MNEINEQLKGISELVTRIYAKVLEITTKLDELIAALHEYDGNDEYGELPFEAFKFTNDYISSLDVDGAERRMDIIGQNGNTGEHYDDDRELGGEGQNNITTQLYDNTNITTNITNHNNNKKQKRINSMSMISNKTYMIINVTMWVLIIILGVVAYVLV